MTLATLVLLSLSALAASARGASADGMLRAKGKMIVDGQDRPVLLRGVNLGNWIVTEGYLFRLEGGYDRASKIYSLTKSLAGKDYSDKYWPEYRKRYMTETDIKEIAACGFNSVRVPLHYSLFTGDGAEGFNLIDSLLGWCRKYGLYVILDLHCAPGGQTGTSIDDDENEKPELWSNDANKAQTVAIWKSIAGRYAEEDIVAGYDLLNEPIPEQFNKYNNELVPLYKTIIAAVRSVDQKHMIFIEGANWASNFSMFTEPLDKNIVYSFHKYWNDNKKSEIDPYLRISDAQDVPLWCGETGENSNQWYANCTQLFEDYGISWCFWPWKKLDAANSPRTVIVPDSFEPVIGYTRGGKMPDEKQTRKAFDDLLSAVACDKCKKNVEVVNSLFRNIPGTVEAENFGYRGEGVSYHDDSAKNEGGAFRTESGVDIQTNGYSVGWTADGEWMDYDINSTAQKSYDVEFRVASPTSDGQFRLEVDGKDVTGPVSVMNTGDWQNWETIVKKGVSIPAGSHKIRFFIIQGGFNVDYFRFK